jgi:excisionase family DNA binding protein
MGAVLEKQIMKSDLVEAAALLTVRQVAALLGVSVRQTWKLASTGRIPPSLRLARSVRWRRGDIEAFISANCDMRSYEAAKGQAVGQ